MSSPIFYFYYFFICFEDFPLSAGNLIEKEIFFLFRKDKKKNKNLSIKNTEGALRATEA